MAPVYVRAILRNGSSFQVNFDLVNLYRARITYICIEKKELLTGENFYGSSSSLYNSDNSDNIYKDHSCLSRTNVVNLNDGEPANLVSVIKTTANVTIVNVYVTNHARSDFSFEGNVSLGILVRA